jgi:hypothetical protein
MAPFAPFTAPNIASGARYFVNSRVAKPIAIIGLMTPLIAAYGAGQSLLHSSM